MRYLKSFLMLTLVGALACSESNAPQPPGVARLEMKEHNIFVFGGRRIPLQSLVTAYDSAGRVIALPTVTVTLPTGWVRSNDTLIAPAGESRGTVRVNAGAHSASSASLMGFANATANADDEPLLDSAIVNSVYDLRKNAWRATFVCRAAPVFPDGQREFIFEDGVDTDSARYVASIDTTFYPEDTKDFMSAGFESIETGYAQLPWSGYELRWRHDGGRDSLARSGIVILWAQRPDSMWFRASRPSSAVNNPAVRVNPGETPRRYVGATWCNIDVWSGHSTHDPMVLEQIGPTKP